MSEERLKQLEEENTRLKSLLEERNKISGEQTRVLTECAAAVVQDYPTDQDITALPGIVESLVARQVSGPLICAMRAWLDALDTRSVNSITKADARLAEQLSLWFSGGVKDPILPPEVCICAAIRMPDGYIVRGHRHAFCIHVACEMPRYAENWECPYKEDQGFITSRNRYVTREEGLRLQKAAGIPSADPTGYRARELFSEDLY